MSETTCVNVTRENRFRFLIDFGPGVPEIMGDDRRGQKPLRRRSGAFSKRRRLDIGSG